MVKKKLLLNIGNEIFVLQRHKSSRYFLIYYPNHRLASKLGLIKAHRLVWEFHNKACLLSWSIVHHKNNNPLDNRPKNLQAMMKYQHSSLHMIRNIINKKDMTNRICSLCKGKTKWRRMYKNNKLYEIWHIHPTTKEFICVNCYQNIRRKIRHDTL